MAKRRPLTPRQLENVRPPLVPGKRCATKPVQVKVVESMYDKWMSFPSSERNAYLRKAIAQFCEENYKEEGEQ